MVKHQRHDQINQYIAGRKRRNRIHCHDQQCHCLPLFFCKDGTNDCQQNQQVGCKFCRPCCSITIFPKQCNRHGNHVGKVYLCAVTRPRQVGTGRAVFGQNSRNIADNALGGCQHGQNKSCCPIGNAAPGFFPAFFPQEQHAQNRRINF